MSRLQTYTVYARNLGRHAVQAYTARHAVAVLVARMKLDEAETACVTTWSVAERTNNLPTDPEVRRRAEIGSTEATRPPESSAAVAGGELLQG